MATKTGSSGKTPESGTDEMTGGSMSNVPWGLHEELYNKIMDDVWAMVQEMAPTLGTVVNGDNGQVQVHFDEEDEPRDVGFSRKKGQRYGEGERVIVGKTRAGRDVVFGSITNKAGISERAIANQDLHDDAIDSRTIKDGSISNINLGPSSVTSDKIANQSITRDKLEAGPANNNTVGRNHITNQAIDTAQLNENAVTSGKLAPGVRDDINNKANKSHTHDYASSSHSHSSYAKQSDLDDLEDRVKKLEDRA